MTLTLSRTPAEIPLSNGTPYQTVTGQPAADHVAVYPARPVSGGRGKVVAFRHADHYLPDMTPREALRVAARIFLAALSPAGGLS